MSWYMPPKADMQEAHRIPAAAEGDLCPEARGLQGDVPLLL